MTGIIRNILLGGLLASCVAFAGSMTLDGLPAGDTDTISIQLSPLNGAIDGAPGTTVGWGFDVNWTSTNGDWVTFTGSSLGSLAQGETNPGLLAPGGYTDFIGAQGGPVDFALSSSQGLWSETFDGVSQGVGSYQIVSDPSVAVPGAQDSGEITFNFQVYNGDPLNGGVQIGNDSYSYYGATTQFAVTADAPPQGAPEAATGLLMGTGLAMAAVTKAVKAKSWRPGRTGLRE